MSTPLYRCRGYTVGAVPPRASARRRAIADAAIEVLAGAGPRGLTHRAVDQRAGLPAGSTSYYLRTRDALLAAAVDRLAERDLEQAAATAAPSTADGLAEFFADQVTGLITTGRTGTIARYHLSLEAARHPAVQESLQAGGRMIAETARALLAAAGFRPPEEPARALVMLCAGIVHESTVGAGPPADRAEVRRMISRLLAGYRTGP
jgi:DNA-binding transcriptional regulator YbjK